MQTGQQTNRTGFQLLYYEEGNPRKHVSPDVFVVRGVKNQRRDNYLVWIERKGPDVVIEITSKSTKREDRSKKLLLCRDILKVPEYFQFDPTEDYLKPPLQGFRLIGGDYITIEPVDGRLPSQILGLHLERHGNELRLYDPSTGSLLLTREEQRNDANRQADAERRNAEAERRNAEAERRNAGAERLRVQTAEGDIARLADQNERLRQELEALKRRMSHE
jgi:hypothetical protein